MPSRDLNPRLAELAAEIMTPPSNGAGQRASAPCSDPFAALAPDSTLAQVEAALEAWASMLAKLPRAGRAIERERAVAAVGQVKAIKGPARLVDGFMPDPAPATGSLTLDDVEPAAEPQDAAALLAELVTIFERHLVLPAGAAIVAASWVLHTWTLDAACFTPRLVVKSPTKRCGKSLLLEVLDALAARAITAANISSAVLFRAIEAFRPSLLVDEADSFLGDDEALRGVLNAGFRYDGLVLRCDGDDLEPRAFRCFAPVAIAAIGVLPATLVDRAFTIEMARKGRAEKVARFDRRARSRLAPLRPRLARWAKDALEELREAAPEVPEALNDRQRDIAEPLIAIADQAGGEWPEKVREAILRLCSASGDDGDRRERLLAAVWGLFAAGTEKFITIKEAVRRLTEDEESEWGEAARDGKPITTRWLARWLSPFGLKSTQPAEFGRVRCYERSSVEPLAVKYLGIEPGEGDFDRVTVSNEPNPPTSGRDSLFDGDRDGPSAARTRKPEKPNGSAVNTVNTVKNPPSGEGEGDRARSFLLHALRDGLAPKERLLREAGEQGISRMDVLSASAGLDLVSAHDEITGALMWGLP